MQLKEYLNKVNVLETTKEKTISEYIKAESGRRLEEIKKIKCALIELEEERVRLLNMEVAPITTYITTVDQILQRVNQLSYLYNREQRNYMVSDNEEDRELARQRANLYNHELEAYKKTQYVRKV